MTDLPAWTEADPVTVDRDQVARFAAAVGHVGPAPIPPTFPITLVWRTQDAAITSFLGPGLGLHGEHALSCARPLVVGESLLPRARVEVVAPRRTGSTVTCRSELLADGRPVVVQLFTVFQVGEWLEPLGRPAILRGDPGLRQDSRHLGSGTDVVGHDQAFRYAGASGDTYRIHTDPDFARELGLPDVILHGMCTLAIALGRVATIVGCTAAEHLRFAAGRFSSPVPIGSRLTTAAYGERACGSFVAMLDDGTEVLTKGRFRFGPCG